MKYVRTYNDARGVLGDVLRFLSRSYENVENIQGVFTDGVRAEFYQRLDQIRNYAEATYNGINDLFAGQFHEQIDEMNAKRVKLLQAQAKEVAKSIGDAAAELNFTVVDAIMQGTQQAVKHVGQVAGTAAKVAGQAAGSAVGGIASGLGVSGVITALVIGAIVLMFVFKFNPLSLLKR